MSAHTPSPWAIGSRYGLLKTEVVAGSRAVCTVWTELSVADRDSGRQTLSEDPEGHANASLIAAAPELLSALTLLLDRHVELVSCGDCGNWDVEREEAVIAARAALSKAEAT